MTENRNSQFEQDVAEIVEAVLPAGLPELVEIDPELTRLVEAWPRLPEHVRQTILTLLGTVTG